MRITHISTWINDFFHPLGITFRCGQEIAYAGEICTMPQFGLPKISFGEQDYKTLPSYI